MFNTAGLRQRMQNAGSNRGVWAAVTLFARLALAVGFLSALADRFGLWGELGTGKVSWGTYEVYLDYVHELAPYLSGGLLDAAGWASTAAEAVLGLTLLLGVALRLSALASAAMLLVFALSMFFFSHPEAPFSASVFSATGLALMLALAPTGTYALSIDRLLGLETANLADARRHTVEAAR